MVSVMTTNTIHIASIAVKHTSGSMWARVIRHLEKELKGIAADSLRAQQIRNAIATFSAHENNRVPWPGTQSSNHKSEPATQC